jgi:cell surface protein SprA
VAHRQANFEIRSDEYEDNRHFFLAHSFRDNYENALSRLPNVTSTVFINRVEVWVTNRNRQTLDVREVIAFADFGEKDKLVRQEFF